VEEDISHLFFECPFAISCWQKLGIHWQQSTCLHDRIARTRQAMQLPYFMVIFIIAAWELWNLRNGKIFEGNSVTMNLWTVRFKKQIIRQLHRVKDDFRPIVIQWLETIM
ncbi:hypothetical protein SETIT_8G148500v2, partial [Setaria italica]